MTASPIVVNKTRQSHAWFQALKPTFERVRYADNMPSGGDILFPKQNAIVFLVEPPKSFTTKDIERLGSDIAFNVRRLAQRVKHSMVILRLDVCVSQWQALDTLQAFQRSLFNQLLTVRLLMAHNEQEWLSAITMFAKTLEPVTQQAIQTRLQQAGKVLRAQSFLSDCEFVTSMMTKEDGLDSHDCLVLQELGTISNIAKASVNELIECSLDTKTAVQVHNFFKHDSALE